MSRRRLRKKESEKPPEAPPPPRVVQTHPKAPAARPKEPKLTLRLRLKQEAPSVAQTSGPATRAASGAAVRPNKDVCDGEDQRGSKPGEKKREQRGRERLREPKVSQPSPQTQTERDQISVSSSSSSGIMEQDSNTQALPTALRSPTESSKAQREPHKAPRVSFEKGTRESSSVPKGRPCCVHPKLFKHGGKCTDATCKVDQSVTIEEVEQLLGINIDEFINDEEYEKMRSRIENLSKPAHRSPKTPKATTTSGECSSMRSNDEPAFEPALKGPTSEQPSQSSPKMGSSAARRTSESEKTSAPRVGSRPEEERRVTFAPCVIHPDSARPSSGSAHRCVNPRGIIRDRPTDHNVPVEEVESPLGIKMDEALPNLKDAKGAKSADGHKQSGNQ